VLSILILVVLLLLLVLRCSFEDHLEQSALGLRRYRQLSRYDSEIERKREIKRTEARWQNHVNNGRKGVVHVMGKY
jgi:hypothetical protein